MKTTFWIAVICLVGAFTPPVICAQDARSPASAAALVQLLEQATLDSFAVKVDGEADRYVAVLYIPLVQLLAVSARYPVPEALDAVIAAADYGRAYGDLNSVALTEGKFFVMDLQADGLRPTRKPDEPFDIVFENVVTQTTFDGDWKKQKLSEREYRERFGMADGRYAAMLDRLVAGLKRSIAP